MDFINNKYIDWNKHNNIEFYRQSIEQIIIDNYIDLTFTKIEDIQNNNKKIIIDIKSEYCRWIMNFIKKYKNEIYNFSLYNYDINDNLGKYIDENTDINNDIRNEIMEISLYCIYKKNKLGKEKFKILDNTIYFIHQKNVISIYNSKEWKFMINEIHRILKPNCKCEFVEYDFIIKNVDDGDITNKINKYFIKKFGKVNIDFIIKNTKKKYNKVETKIIKLPLYDESIFKSICIENVIIGYSYFMEDIIKVLKKKYNILLTFKEIVNILLSEWKYKKSYIEIYFISAQK